MKNLALLAFSAALVAAPHPAAAGHSGHGGSHGGFHGGSHPGFHGGNPASRHWAHGAHFARHPHFRFRGHSFIVIGAPLLAAPWFYYPYAWDPYWGPRYYVPGQAGSFLYYCQDPPGYYPEVQSCYGGWVRVVPDEGTDDEY